MHAYTNAHCQWQIPIAVFVVALCISRGMEESERKIFYTKLQLFRS